MSSIDDISGDLAGHGSVLTPCCLRKPGSMSALVDVLVLKVSTNTLQPGRVVKAYEYYQTCIATKTFEFFGFLGEARNDTPNLTSCFTNVPNLILLKIGHLFSSFVQAFP